MRETHPTPSTDSPSSVDVLVVGAGLGGLAAAAYAARGGAEVLLLEKTETLGGRAATHQAQGFSFNIGPHALYSGCEAAQVLGELGVSYSGRRPPVSGGLALRGGRLHTLPGGLLSLLTTGLLPLPAKLELAKVLSSLPKVEAGPMQHVSLSDWLRTTFRHQGVRELIAALMRLTGYANDAGRASAGASIAQLQRGLTAGVTYVDGGWQSLVAGLASSARQAGAGIDEGSRVRSVTASPTGAGFDVACDSGRSVHASAVVLALPPTAAASLYEGPGAAEFAASAKALRPVKAACLDLGLRRLPNPRALFCLGVDRPLYFSVHSASAALAPEGGALVHVAKYLPGSAGDGKPDPKADEAELEAFADLVQPGWRKEVIERRFLPTMTVVHALVEAGKARPSVQVAGVPGLWLAGDWVGREGMLADTALASGREAGKAAAAAVNRGGAAIGRRAA